MKILLMVTNQPNQTFDNIEDLLSVVIQFKGFWFFSKTITYKMTSFSQELKEAVSKNPEEIKISFSKSLVTINAFGNKNNLYSKAITL